jgi:hypothetical protein
MWQRHLKSNILSNLSCENKTSPKIISPSEAVIEHSWYFYDPQFWQTAV